MEIINFDKNNIISELDNGRGAEGIAYLYNDNGHIVVFKKFYDKNDLLEVYRNRKEFTAMEELYKDDEEIDNTKNKELKLMILKHEELLQKDIKLLKRVYYMGKFIGFTSEYEPYEPLSFISKKNEKIRALSLVQDRYEELNKRGIYIGDFNQTNFCLDGDRIKLYDIDNFRVGDLDFNVQSVAMMEYMNRCSDMKNIDFYCFNYFALSCLSSYQTDSILRGIAFDSPKFPHYLKTKEVLRFVNFLENMNDNTKIEKTPNGKQKTLLYLLQ